MTERNFFTHQQPTKRLKAYVAYCRTCGCPWLVLPASERAVRADTLSAQEAKACGINVADAVREYVDELERQSARRRFLAPLARVASCLRRALADYAGGAGRSRDYGVPGRWN